MAKGKIAPTLREVIGVEARISWNRQTAEQANAELKALLAVIRCARRERESILEIAKYARECHPGEADGDYVGRMLEDSDERMACALLRLDRVSSKGDDK